MKFRAKRWINVRDTKQYCTLSRRRRDESLRDDKKGEICVQYCVWICAELIRSERILYIRWGPSGRIKRRASDSDSGLSFERKRTTWSYRLKYIPACLHDILMYIVHKDGRKRWAENRRNADKNGGCRIQYMYGLLCSKALNGTKPKRQCGHDLLSIVI